MASQKGFTEDKAALLIGILIFLAAALKIANIDLLGWAVTATLWTDPLKAMGATTPVYAKVLPGIGALLVTYAVVTALLAWAVSLWGGNIGRFVRQFTVVFLSPSSVSSSGPMPVSPRRPPRARDSVSPGPWD